MLDFFVADFAAAFFAGAFFSADFFAAAFLAGAFFTAAFAVLLDSYQRTRGLTPRRQVKWLLWGTAAGVFPFLAFYALPFALGREPGLALQLAGYGPLAFVPLSLAWTISDKRTIESIGRLSLMAEKYGVTLCVKAHVGAAIYNTPTTLKLMQAVSSPAFGIDMDPSHIWRAGENPVEAIAAVVSRVKHVHIRDCKGRQQNPGRPEDQANGRGDIDLVGYVRVLHQAGYAGPLDLEVIGAKDRSLVQCAVIAAESRGHMQACLQACGAR